MNQLFLTSTNNVCMSMGVCEKFLEWQSMRFLLAFTGWVQSQSAAIPTQLTPFCWSAPELKFPNTVSKCTLGGKSYLRIFDGRRRTPTVGTIGVCLGRLSGGTMADDMVVLEIPLLLSTYCAFPAPNRHFAVLKDSKR